MRGKEAKTWKNSMLIGSNFRGIPLGIPPFVHTPPKWQQACKFIHTAPTCSCQCIPPQVCMYQQGFILFFFLWAGGNLKKTVGGGGEKNLSFSCLLKPRWVLMSKPVRFCCSLDVLYHSPPLPSPPLPA